MQRFLVFCVAGLVSVQPTFAVTDSAVNFSEAGPTEIESTWNLDGEEILRYRTIEPAIRSFVDPNITPLEVLGMYAESQQERETYARRFVEANIRHTQKALEWGVLVDEAAKSINLAQHIQSSNVIQRSLDTEKTRLEKVQSNWFGLGEGKQSSAFLSKVVQSRGSLYVETDCAECVLEFQKQYKRVKEGKLLGLDVVFAGMDSADRPSITRWATSVGLSMSDVSTRRVTLNFEGDTWRNRRGGRSVPLFLGSE